MIATVFDKILLLGEFVFGIIFIIILGLLSTKDKNEEELENEKN